MKTIQDMEEHLNKKIEIFERTELNSWKLKAPKIK